MEEKIEEPKWEIFREVLEKHFSSMVYMSPKIGSPGDARMSDSPFDPRFTGRDFKIELISVPDALFKSRLAFVDNAEPYAADFPFYRLRGCFYITPDGKKTLEQQMDEFTRDRVFVSPEIYSEGEKKELRRDISSRPYKFLDIFYGDAQMFSSVRFLDGKEPKEKQVAFFYLIESKIMPAEEAAKRMKKE